MSRTLTILLFIIFIIPAAAVSATIDPPSITIDDAGLGSTYLIIFNVTNPGTVNATYTLNATGGIQPWIDLPVRNITIAPNSSHELNATITIPKDVFMDTGWGNINIQNASAEGVNLPITINIRQDISTKEIVRYIVIVIIVLGLLIIFRTRPKSRARHFIIKS